MANTKAHQGELSLGKNSNGVMSIKDEDTAVLQLTPLPREVLDKLQKFQQQLDRRPRKVVDETQGGQTYQQLPITYVEHLLKRLFFGIYKIEIIHYGMVVNEVCVHARIHVFHPIICQWLTFDGVGAIPVMMNTGAKVNQFIEQKKTKALNLNLPAAYALAIKNAAKKIGKVFGADLNRKLEDTYEPFPLQEPLNE